MAALTQHEKDILKKSLAKLMVYWICQTRHDLRDDLAQGVPPWAGGNINSQSVWRHCPDLVTTLSDEINEFSQADFSAKSYRSNTTLRSAAEYTNGIADRDWEQGRCPSNNTINAMFAAAVSRIQRLTEIADL